MTDYSAAEQALMNDAQGGQMFMSEEETAKFMQRQDLKDHDITPAVMASIQSCVMFLRSLLPSLTYKLRLQPGSPSGFAPMPKQNILEAYSTTKMHEDLLIRTMHVVREFQAGTVGGLKLTTSLIWLCVKELVCRFGHVYPDIFVPRWPRHVTLAATKVLPIFVAIKNDVTLKNLEDLCYRIWRVFIVSPSAGIVVRERKARSDKGVKRDRDQGTPTPNALEPATPETVPASPNSIMTRSVLSIHELLELGNNTTPFVRPG